jgi:signal transduction histidine kinase
MVDTSKLLEIFLASTIHEAKNHLGYLSDTLEAVSSSTATTGSTGTDSAENHPVQLTETILAHEQPPQLMLQKAKDQIYCLNHLLTQVLVHYRGVHNGYQLHMDQVDLEDFLEELSDRYHNRFAYRGISLSAELLTDEPAFFDEQLINNVLDTLIANAITAGATALKLQLLHDSDQYLLIRLDDNGPGFPDSLLHHNLATLQTAQAHENKTGLGLYLANQILQAHHQMGKVGSILLENNPDTPGARATLKLP